MIANRAAGDLPGLLAALVPAAVDGLVRDVTVVDAAPAPAAQEVCEDAGAEIAASLADAARRVRSDLILVLPANMRLKPGWQGAVGAHLTRGGKAAVLAGEGAGWFRSGVDGWLVERRGLAAAPDLAAVKRAAKGPRL